MSGRIPAGFHRANLWFVHSSMYSCVQMGSTGLSAGCTVDSYSGTFVHPTVKSMDILMDISLDKAVEWLCGRFSRITGAEIFFFFFFKIMLAI